MENIIIGLEIMGLGMGGIFVALLIIMLAVFILQKTDNMGKNKEK